MQPQNFSPTCAPRLASRMTSGLPHFGQHFPSDGAGAGRSAAGWSSSSSCLNFSIFLRVCASSPNTPHFRAYQGQPDPLTALLHEPFLLREDNSGTKQETLYFLQNHDLSLDELNHCRHG